MTPASQRRSPLIREFKKRQKRLLELEPIPELDILWLDQLPPGETLVHPLLTDVRPPANQRIAFRKSRRVRQPARADASGRQIQRKRSGGVLHHRLALDEPAHHLPAFGEDPPSLLGSLEPLGVVRLTQHSHGSLVVDLPERPTGAFSLWPLADVLRRVELPDVERYQGTDGHGCDPKTSDVVYGLRERERSPGRVSKAGDAR